MIKLIFRQIFFVLVSFTGVTLISYMVLNSADHGANTSLSYWQYISNIFKGDFGTSLVTAEPTINSFLLHLPASLELVLLSSILALLVGLPLGVIAAKYHRTPIDTIINNISITAYSMPIFWWAILLIVYIAIEFQLTPVAGRLNFIYDIEPVTGFMLIDTFISDQSYRMEAFFDAINHLILPVITLATLPAAIICRMTRQTMLTTLNADYIKTAQAKGLNGFGIYWIHGLRNALIPLTNMLGLQVSTLMTGAILTEYIFSWPGIGKWLLDALSQTDYQALSTGILITTSMVILINAVIELLGFWLNPQTKSSKRIYHG